MTPEQTDSELQLAWSRFQETVSVHRAAIQSLELLRTLPDAKALLMARIRGRHGFDRDIDLRSLEVVVERMLESIDDESESGFQILRASALVSVCSAFEHLIKARYVAFAAQDPGRAAEQLASAKVSVRMEVSDVLGLPVLEQWFTVADELFKKAGSGRTSMSERVKIFLLDYCLLLGREGELRRQSIIEAFEGPETRRFNEAFLYRNCVVHNGARVDRKLASGSSLELGATIVLSGPVVNAMVEAVRKVAWELDPRWLIPL